MQVHSATTGRSLTSTRPSGSTTSTGPCTRTGPTSSGITTRQAGSGPTRAAGGPDPRSVEPDTADHHQFLLALAAPDQSALLEPTGSRPHDRPERLPGPRDHLAGESRLA